MLNRFWLSRSGNFAMMFAILLPVLLAAVGFALDIANLMKARSDLQNALDSAVLAASRLSDQTGTRQATFDAFFAANVANKPALVNAKAKLVFEQTVNEIKTTATADANIKLNFAFIFGQSSAVAATANAFESNSKLEVALVLDNTGSMGAANMAALIEGSKEIIKTLQKVKADRPERQIRAALVPFVTAVNIKSAEGFSQSWIDMREEVPLDDKSWNGKNFEPNLDEKGKDKSRVGHWKLFKDLEKNWKTGPKGEWKGCVEARRDIYALTDDAPDITKPDTLFVPYFAPDEPGGPIKSPNSGDYFNNSYLDDVVGGTNAQKQKSQKKYSDATARANAKLKETPNDTTGPNYGCATPVVPLTEDLVKLGGDPVKKIKGELDNMNFWYGSGTNVSEGLAWGYRVLSPGAPFTEGDAFKAADTSKVVVVFTDGENNVFGAAKETINRSDYGSYSYLDTGRMGALDRAGALKKVNEATKTVCADLKKQDVIVYTVVLGADTPANRDLYSTCATGPGYYFPTKNIAELKAAFQTIANSISPLLITH
ncbi:pilus assembly protein [Aminobacter sp. NyZ550]|uniref:TadE/TadG family type IV pilus assembly protein n=1 Tax=Aminobacter sp. NyZ550 TaxID=2979870 RepID=UPI0021D5A649|nr:pilus assembly protein [Aminobacter sp. NyZ550]WAX97298.1 pilus assembly protein [Aminobacter sp. NyZ550]